MRRVLLAAALVLAAGVATVAASADSDDGPQDPYVVRAVFANAFALVPGLDVKVAGVPVGKVRELEVTPEGRAAVVLRIDDPGFRDWRTDARCSIRPQSLIGERYVACTPTQRRAAGTAAARALPVVPEGRPGAGQRLLGPSRTTKPVDQDLVLNTMRLPERERLRIVLGELGVGLSARGDDLRAALRQADPALAAADRVLSVVRTQTRTLERLAADADRALAPVSRDRRDVADFVSRTARVATVGARRSTEVREGLRRLPGLLRELPATLDDLGALAEEATPVAADLRSAAPALGRAVAGTPALARAAAPALEALGQAADVGRPVLVRSRPVLRELRTTARTARPVSRDLGALTASLDDAGIAGRIVDFLYATVMSANGYDAAGHYLRAGLIVNACSTYVTESTPDCAATFEGRGRDPKDAGAVTARSADRLLDFLLGEG